MTRPADELRTAAQTLRTLATAASTNPDGTPTANWNTSTFADSSSPVLCGDYRTRDDGKRISWPPLIRGGSQHRHAYMAPHHSAYAAAMGPAVGLALARAFAETADSVEQDGDIAQDSTTEALLDTARSINGSSR